MDEEFAALVEKAREILEGDAGARRDYYVGRNGEALEEDVMRALNSAAADSSFEGRIEHVGGHRFPDIKVGDEYGVEVKSTNKNRWTSTGSSIIESTRIEGVRTVYIMFGNLGADPIRFMARPYEECQRDIAVTHMPRYLIDMQLEEGHTVFDHIGLPYDVLRQMDNPIAPVSEYYAGLLQPGETLWWAGIAAGESAPATLRLWRTLTVDEKRRLTTYGLVNYPEVFGGNYDAYALWLTSSQSVVDTHIRDQFSAGGREEIMLPGGELTRLPAIYRKVEENADDIVRLIASQSALVVPEALDRDSPLGGEILRWCDAASNASRVRRDVSMDCLTTIMFG